jgi:hypothetical protein
MITKKENMDDLNTAFALDLIAFYNVVFDDILRTVDDNSHLSVNEIISQIEDRLQ